MYQIYEALLKHTLRKSNSSENHSLYILHSWNISDFFATGGTYNYTLVKAKTNRLVLKHVQVLLKYVYITHCTAWRQMCLTYDLQTWSIRWYVYISHIRSYISHIRSYASHIRSYISQIWIMQSMTYNFYKNLVNVFRNWYFETLDQIRVSNMEQ